VIRPAEWQASPLGELQALPKNAKPVTLWANQDSAWLDIANGIRKAIGELQAGVKAKVALKVTPVGPVDEKSTKAASKPRKVGTEKLTGEEAAASTLLRRTIYTANHSETLPGRVARREGEPPKGNAAIDEAYDFVGLVYRFFKEIFQRDSVDVKGMPLEVIVHYGKSFNNGFWNGKQLIMGDGDGHIFNRFTLAPEVMASEFTKGVIDHDAQLEYWDNPARYWSRFR
jgi:Zn-dependent metalloprotease